jgi:hypothetical protein
MPARHLVVPACAAIGNAMTAAMIRINFRRMNDAPYVSASFRWFGHIGKLGPWGCDAIRTNCRLRFRTLFGPKR